MPRRDSTDEVLGALGRIGFQSQRQRGSHIRLSAQWRGATRYVTIVAGQRQLDPKTVNSICRQAGITLRELDLLVEGDEIRE